MSDFCYSFCKEEKLFGLTGKTSSLLCEFTLNMLILYMLLEGISHLIIFTLSLFHIFLPISLPFIQILVKVLLIWKLKIILSYTRKEIEK